jgi:hypothetical protein
VLGPTDPDLANLTKLPLNRPFWPLSMGYNNGADPLYGGARGIDNTILRGNGNALTFDASAGSLYANYQYQRKELLTKIYNNVTTRGNVFAVWMTVGFFEVDAQGRLGAEMGKSENRQVRHRGFAIVDRTQMRLLDVIGTSNANSVQPGVEEVLTGVTTLTDARTGVTWPLQAGNLFVLEPDTVNEETVTLFIDPNQNNSLAFIPKRAHPKQFLIRLRGNPGPWLRYDAKKDTDVVPYFAVID